MIKIRPEVVPCLIILILVP